MFALYPAAPLDESAPVAPANGTALFQRSIRFAIPFISATVIRDAGGFDARYTLPTVLVDPGQSVLVDPMAQAIGSLEVRVSSNQCAGCYRMCRRAAGPTFAATHHLSGIPYLLTQ